MKRKEINKLFNQVKDKLNFKVTYDELMIAYVELMYEMTTDNRIYSDLYLYKLGYGACLPEEPGLARGLMWTDQVGNLMEINKCHSGVYVIYTKDKRWMYIAMSVRMEEAVKLQLLYLNKGLHWNKPMQHYFDIEKGDLEIDVLEFCPRRLLKVVRKKWCKYYGQPMGSYNRMNIDFKEEDYL